MDMLTVLVVDDEPLIALLVEAALGDAGFAVAIAHSEAEALSSVDTTGSSLAALVTDIRLGTGSGWVVATHARVQNPDLPVVYISGDSGGLWKVHGVPESIMISKPFAVGQVVAAVTTLLNTPASSINPA